MLMTLIAVIFAGFAGAGLALALRFGTGRRLPGWITPLGAGAAMIAATIATEYGWYDTTTGSMPEGMEVIVTHERSAWWQPWTYLRPYRDGFIAVDIAGIRSNEDAPGLHLVNLYVFGRWAATTEVPMAVDCTGNRQLTLIDRPDLSLDSLTDDAPWIALREDDPLRLAVCNEATT